jgi:hypothetical protein
MWQIEFTSERFLPYLPEHCQSNPGAYGFELAHWLSMELMKRGVATSYPLDEDWGWFIEYGDDEVELRVCCASQAEYGDGYTGNAIRWSVYIRAPSRFFSKRNGPQVAAAATLSRHIEAALREASIVFTQVED